MDLHIEGVSFGEESISLLLLGIAQPMIFHAVSSYRVPMKLIIRSYIFKVFEWWCFDEP